MLGIIGAMEIEIDALKTSMRDSKVSQIAGMDFYCGKIDTKEVVVVKSGVGKVNAAVCAQILADIFSVDAVINTGVAGALNPGLRIGDIVISTEALEHDADVTPLGYEAGQVPGMPCSCYPADQKLQRLAEECFKRAELSVSVFSGRVVSGDQFIATTEKKAWLRETFLGDCAEMEGAAVAHTAYLNKIPFLIIRAISDQADGSSRIDYPMFEKKAAENSVGLLMKLIKAYE